jgi:hypothetical protein
MDISGKDFVNVCCLATDDWKRPPVNSSLCCLSVFTCVLLALFKANETDTSRDLSGTWTRRENGSLAALSFRMSQHAILPNTFVEPDTRETPEHKRPWPPPLSWTRWITSA